MYRMFFGYYRDTSLTSWFTRLSELNVSGWDTSNVTDMRNMFNYQYSLRE